MKTAGIKMAAGLAALLLCTGCRAVPVSEPPPAAEPEPLRWLIVDSQGTGKEEYWDGRAVREVFERLEQTPVITYYAGEQDVLISRLLARAETPDILTVPAGGALREKVLGSGNVWNIQELSEELYTSIPDEVRQVYQNNSGELFSLPGGYTAENYRPVAVEGVYVRQEYASLLGDPAMDTVERFARAVEAFVRLAAENTLVNSGELVPVVFGVNGSGLATVEHICGVHPFYQEGTGSYHRIFSPAVGQAMAFFDSLDALSVFPIFEPYSDRRLTELLRQQVFVYIGPAAFIQSFNLANPGSAFVEVTPPFAPDGYLEAQSRWGTYETFVFRGGDGEAAARLLQTLSSSQASRTFLYGVEDEDWVLVNGGVTPLKSTLHKLQADPRAYLQQTGIGSFPFLSREGTLNPYAQLDGTRALDISREKVYFSASDYHGYYLSQMDARLKAYYTEAANPSVSAADILARIRTLEDEKEPLAVSR